ncbi:hypothetical protein Tco_0828263, partial [Tanacetum coccineum]
IASVAMICQTYQHKASRSMESEDESMERHNSGMSSLFLQGEFFYAIYDKMPWRKKAMAQEFFDTTGVLIVLGYWKIFNYKSRNGTYITIRDREDAERFLSFQRYRTSEYVFL